MTAKKVQDHHTLILHWWGTADMMYVYLNLWHDGVNLWSLVPPFNGVLHRLEGFWSTPEEVLHTVQGVHRRSWGGTTALWNTSIWMRVCGAVCESVWGSVRVLLCLLMLWYTSVSAYIEIFGRLMRKQIYPPSTTSMTQRPSRDGTWLAAAVWTAIAPPILCPIIIIGGGDSP